MLKFLASTKRLIEFISNFILAKLKNLMQKTIIHLKMRRLHLNNGI